MIKVFRFTNIYKASWDWEGDDPGTARYTPGSSEMREAYFTINNITGIEFTKGRLYINSTNQNNRILISANSLRDDRDSNEYASEKDIEELYRKISNAMYDKGERNVDLIFKHGKIECKIEEVGFNENNDGSNN